MVILWNYGINETGFTFYVKRGGICLATINDVAKLSGVAKATVSRYLNKSGFVSEKSQQKIKEAMEALDYQPSVLASAVKTQKTYTVACVVPNISNSFFSELVEQIERSLVMKGYKTILCNVNEDAALEQRYLDIIKQHKVDGLIVATGTLFHEKLDPNLPLILVDRAPCAPLPHSIVLSDHYEGAMKAVMHLVHNGCKKILHLTSNGNEEAALRRKEAFVRCMETTQIAHTIACLENCSAQEIVQLTQQRFDGVFAWCDMSALKWMDVCREHHISIPADQQLVGYDDISIAKYLYPKLTTIRQPMEQIAHHAVEMLLERMESGVNKKVKVLLDNELIIRETTKEVEGK